MFKKAYTLGIITLLLSCSTPYNKIIEKSSIVTYSGCDDQSNICEEVPYNLELNSSANRKLDKSIDYFSIYKNKIVRNTGYILGCPLQGHYIKRDSGIIVEEGYFNDGVKSGIWKTYYQNGSIKSSVPFRNGLKDGTEEFTSIDGSKTTYSIYKNGKIVPEKVRKQRTTKNDSIPNAQD